MSDEELLETYRAANNKAMDEASARDGFATNMSRESIVAGLRAVFDMSKGEKRAEWEAELGETEWEYEATPDWIEGIRWSGTSLERHLSNLDRYSDPNGGWWYGEKENKPDRITYQARRRRKAGPWEPVPDTTNNESEGKA